MSIDSAANSSELSLADQAGVRVNPPGGPRASAFPCSRCGQTNDADRRFCHSCGAALFLPCGQCKQENPVGERFCANCGANLANEFAERWDQLHRSLLAAWRSCRDSRFSESLGRLNVLDNRQDPRTDVFADSHDILTHNVKLRGEKARQTVQHSVEDASKFRQGGNLPALIQALRTIPAAMRDDEQASELRNAESMLVELRTLRQRLEAATDEITNAQSNPSTAQFDAGELLAKTRRILELDPNDEACRELIPKLEHIKRQGEQTRRKQSVLAAKECLAQHDYINALRHVESIPRTAWDEKLESSHDELSELAWLERELRISPFVNRALLQFANRLAKMRPDDTRPTSWSARLSKQLSGAAEEPPAGGNSVLWTKPPEATLLGPPIRLAGQPRSVSFPDGKAAAEVSQRVPRLAVAFGLALQGLGFGRIQCNLIANMKRSGLGKLFAKNKDNVAWGIDIGSSAIKIVALSKASSGVNWVQSEIEEHATPLNRASSPDERKQITRDTLKRITEKAKLKVNLKNTTIGVGVSGSRSLGRFFRLPAVDSKAKNAAKRVKDLIRFEAEAQIPFPLAEMQWDGHVFGRGESQKSTGSQSVAMIAAKTNDVRDLLDVFEKTDIKPDYAQADCFSLYNVMAHGFLPKEGGAGNPAQAAAARRKTFAIIDSGSHSTNVVFGSGHHVWFRSYAFAGEEFLRRVARELKVSLAQADALNREPWKLKRIHKFADGLLPSIEKWGTELKRTFRAYKNANEKLPVSAVLLAGGGTQTLGLPRYLVRGQ